MMMLKRSRATKLNILIFLIVLPVLFIGQACDAGDNSTNNSNAARNNQLIPASIAESTPIQVERSATPVLEATAIPGRYAALPEAGAEPWFAKPHPLNFEQYLSGETLTRYQALPVEFQEALQAYMAWGIDEAIIPTMVEQKMDQWPSNPAPLSEVLSPEGYQLFQEVEFGKYHQALFLLYFYPYVINNGEGADAQQRAQLLMLIEMQPKQKKEELAHPAGTPGTSAYQQAVDTLLYSDAQDSPINLGVLDRVLLPETVQRLGMLGPNLQQAVRSFWANWTSDTDYYTGMLVTMNDLEVFILKTPAEEELPSLKTLLSDDSLLQLQGLQSEMRSAIDKSFNARLFQGTNQLKTDPHSTVPFSHLLLNIVESIEKQIKRSYEANLER